MFPLYSERLTAGGKQPNTWRGAQQPARQAGHCIDHVLAVVQHQQQLDRAERIDDRLDQLGAVLNSRAQGFGDCVTNRVGLVQWRQLDDERPAREVLPRRPRGFNGQTRLADPARSGEGHQPVWRELGSECFELLHPTHEGRGGLGEVPVPRYREQRRIGQSQTRGAHGEHPLRLL